MKRYDDPSALSPLTAAAAPANAARGRGLRPARSMLALETRIVFDGAVAATLAEPHDGILARAFAGTKTRFCLISFDSDWLYPTAESRRIVHALNAAGAAVSFVELSSPFGHDAFLLEAPEMNRIVDGFLRAGEQ